MFEACAYWAPLLHLLLYRLGWSRPDLGVRQWFDDGKPTDDETLALLSARWDADGQLDSFAQWLWVNWMSFPVPLRNVPGVEACPRLQIHYTVLERLRGRRTPRVLRGTVSDAEPPATSRIVLRSASRRWRP